MRLKGKPGVAMLVAFGALAAAASPAGAASFTLPGQTGVSNRPSVAVDASGNAYVAWVDTSSKSGAAEVCELPAGATTCANEGDLAVPSGLDEAIAPWVYVDSSGDPHVIISGETGNSASEVDYSSADHGATWTATPTMIGDLALSSAAFDPDIGSGVVFGASDYPYDNSYGVAVNAAELQGGTTGTDAVIDPFGPENPSQTGSAVSDTPAGISAVHAWDKGIPSNPTGVGYAYYTGPPLKGQPAATVIGDIGDTSNWTTSTVGDGGRYISLAGGPAGIFLNEAIGNAGEIANRQFTGSGFGGPVVADCGDTPHYSAGIQGSQLFEDPVTGALHFVYVESNGSGTEDVRYTQTLGGAQSPPVTLSESTSNNQISPTVASNGAGHAGIAVWLSDQPAGYAINADWLPAVSLTGCPSSSGGGGGQSGPGGGTTPTSSISTTVEGQQLTLTTPSLRGCLDKSSTLNVSLTSKSVSAGKHGKGAKPRFKPATFYIDRGVRHTRKVKVKHGKTRFKKVTSYGPNATAHHLPVTEHLKIGGLKSGPHTLTVKVSFKETRLRHGHKTIVTVKTTLKAKFEIC